MPTVSQIIQDYDVPSDFPPRFLITDIQSVMINDDRSDGRKRRHIIWCYAISSAVSHGGDGLEGLRANGEPGRPSPCFQFSGQG
tara:strand:- start:284 stop:535 length:252 start_codon:yes stop_codon:yes gene_type:complete